MARARRRCPVTERSVLASCVRSARSSISGSLPSDRHQSHRGEPLGIHEVRTPQGTITFDLFVRARPGRAVGGEDGFSPRADEEAKSAEIGIGGGQLRGSLSGRDDDTGGVSTDRNTR